MSDGVSLREFGRLVGVSGEAVRKAIKTGRIPAELVGEHRLSSGRVVPIIKDASAAAAAFGGNTNPIHRQDRGRISERVKTAKSTARESIASEIEGFSLPGAVDHRKVIPKLQESLALKEYFKAKCAELEYEEKLGKLVDAEAFRTKFATLVTSARTRLLAVPSKAKHRIPHLSVDEVGVLTGLIREALEEIADGR
jgi:phage terminase Nu1 subunit (DNA packaging protein)